MKTFLICIIFLLTVLGTSSVSGIVSEEGVNVAEELFHRRFTVVEDFGSKSALIQIHLTSIDMLVSVTVNSVNKSVSSFTTAYLPGKTFTNEAEMEKGKEMDTVKVDTNQSSKGCSITNKAWNSLLSAVKSAVKWLHIGIDWLKDTNSDTVTASDSNCSSDGIVNHSMSMDLTEKDQTQTCPVASSIQLMTLTDSKPESMSLSKKSENGKVNTTLPATSLKNRETNVTASSGKAEREVNDIMGNGINKRREPIVVFIGNSDSEELSKDESSELPKFTSSPFFSLHPEICSSNRQENHDVMFLGVMGYYGMASHKTVPEYHDTVTTLDREEDEISTALGTSSIEETHPKENGLALRQKDTEIGTFALLDEPQSTLRNETLSDLVDTKNQTTNFNSEKADERNEDVKIVIDTFISSNNTEEDLTICPDQPLTGGSSLNKVHSEVCMKDGERLGLRIDNLPSLATQYQDITFLRNSPAAKSRSRWMTKLVKDESTHAFYITGFNHSGTECCSKKTSSSVDSSWFITRLWSRGLVSVGLGKPSSVPRKTTKRPQYQRLTDVPISVNVFEICMTEINQTGPETTCCTKKAAKRQAESESFTAKLWIKGVEFVGWIRSNETREKARNLANFYLTKFLTKMINWTWQDTFDMMTMILATECCYTAMYIAISLIINIIKSFIRLLIQKWRLYRKNRKYRLEKERERLRQEELARERAAQPKPWRPKQPRKRKVNFCGRLQKW